MIRSIREFLVTRKHNERGEEVPDPRPVEIPADCRRPESLQEMVARLVMVQDFRNSLARQGAETLEEANDFDIDGDDPEEVFSQHERLAHEIAENDDVREASSHTGRRAIKEASDRIRRKAGDSGGIGGERRDDDERNNSYDDGGGNRRGSSFERGGEGRRADRSVDRSRRASGDDREEG